MKAYYCDSFVLPLPAGHRFPMDKYRRLRERLEADVAMLELELLVPPAASTEDLVRVHCPAYVERVRLGTMSEREQRKLGFPWSVEMAERTRRVSGATCAALVAALDDGIAVNLAGGTHHADYDHGAGYCVFNDSVVGARHLQARGLAQRILVIDLDVHHGNGTAALTARDPSIWTFSMHAARNYPAHKPPSDLDIALADGVGDDEYLQRLADALPAVLSAARADAAIYLAGADPYVGDQLGFLALSHAGLAQRDRLVLESLDRAGLPVAITMGGGYAAAVEDIVAIHYRTVATAAALCRRRRQSAVPRPPVFTCAQLLE